ncbi:JmjC-domain-containing protein, partial [Atractiella rhizophila]
MANSASSSSATSTNPSITPKPAARSNLIVKEESLETPKVMERVKEATKRLEEALNTESGMEVEEEVPPGELCEVCGTDDRPEAILLCDGCERGWHLDCLTPPLKSVPKSPSWLCDGCLRVIGGDYGFDEGQTHSLYSFKKRADRFRELWLARHPVKHTREGEVEDHLEREFWRLVESPSETVEVEYGADIYASKYGSGLPGLEKDPTNPYARDGWNLNNLPILPGSLLRYIKSDVSGMTVPWVYVGMLFSTFAWHKEDHYTYSINFQSWGATKTWYGVPGHQDELLDSAMKAAAPELFQQQPDLLFQLVTLMSPGRLKKAGVKVYAVDQRPNEFVITFPKAYHAGFNQGLNYNTAVNFALPDWLDKGLECVMAYKELSKPPVFCHDELLVTISVHDKTAGTSKWLLPAYREMVDREVRRRNVLREELPEIEEDVDSQDVADGEYQCSRCQGMYYLSQVIHRPSARITCLEHHSSLPKEGTKALRLRFADEELRRMLGRVRSRSEGGRGGGGVLFDGGEVRKSKRERKPSRALLEAQGLDGSSSEDGEGELPIEMSRKRAREEPIEEAENEEMVDY